MFSDTVVLVIILAIAILLDLYFVSGLRRYRRLRNESIDDNGVLQTSAAELRRLAFFPFLKSKPIEKRPIPENPFRNLPRFYYSAIMPIASLLLLSAGIFQLRGEIWVSGTVCLLFAMVGLIVGLRRLEAIPLTAEDVEALKPWIMPVILWAVILALWGLAVIYVADHIVNKKTDYAAAGAWVCSMALAMAAVWRSTLPKRALVLEKLKVHRTELLILLSILIMAFLLRTIGLSNHPYPLHGDEAAIGLEGRRILSGEVTNLFAGGWSYQSNWSFVPTALSEFVFGDSIRAIRLAGAFAGTLAVLFVYLAGREMLNGTLGLLAACLLATLPIHVHFSRLAVSNIVDSLFSAIMFWLLMRGLRKSDARYLYTAGVVAGLSLYTYSGTRLILILAFVTFLFLILRERGFFATRWKLLLSFAGGALLSAVPQAAYFIQNRDIFLGRFGEATIFLNGWLESYAELTAKSTIEILFEQFSGTVLVFIASPAFSNFFNSPDPYLTLLGSILFLLGMAYALAHLRELRFFILMLWFWSVVILGGVITVSPPAHTRMLMTTPALCLFVALGAGKIVEYLRKFQIIKPTLAGPFLIVLASIVSWQHIDAYMFDYRSNMNFADYGGEFELEMATISNNLGPDVRIFVVGVPHVSASSPALTFIAPGNEFSGLTAQQIDGFYWDAAQPAAFFFIPDYRSRLEEFRQKYPGGQSKLFYRRSTPDEILFAYYILPAAE